MSSNPATPASPPVPRRRLAIALVLIVLGLGLAVAAVLLAQRHWRQNTVQGIAAGVIAGFGSELPKDYGNGLVLERVLLEDRDIVLLIRSTRLSLAAAARDPDRFEQARKDEQALMRPLCDLPEVRQVLAQGLTVTRRYVDTGNRLFFEFTLTARDCG